MKFYGFAARSISGELVSMRQFAGKVVVVVNTASECGFTPQYQGLQKLYDSYKDRGLVILGFPCNQFGGQEPGKEGEIQAFCQRNYGVTFPMFAKVEVNGRSAHPLFSYLKSALGGFLGSRIKWNFTKFIVDREGRPVKRFGSTTKPARMEMFLKKLLDS